MLTSLCFNTPTSFVVLEKRTSSDNPVLRTLTLCCRDGVGAVCDLLVNVNNLSLPFKFKFAICFIAVSSVCMSSVCDVDAPYSAG